MAMKWCIKLEVGLLYCFSRSSVIFQGRTGQKSPILTWIGRFRTVTPVWIHRWLQNFESFVQVYSTRLFQFNWSSICTTKNLVTYTRSIFNRGLHRRRRMLSSFHPSVYPSVRPERQWSRSLFKMAMLGQFLHIPWNFEIVHDRVRKWRVVLWIDLSVSVVKAGKRPWWNGHMPVFTVANHNEIACQQKAGADHKLYSGLCQSI